MLRPEVESFFLEAMNLDRGEQRRYLDLHCTDPEIRREVESLLAHDTDSEEFLESAVQDAAQAVREWRELSSGETVGPYRITGLLGRGGMGVVYRAERHDGGFAQTVAIKLLQGTRWRASLIARFQDERKILARLSHPNIGRLLDGGTTTDGLPYYVMELVEGVPVDDWAAGRSVSEVVKLFLTVCDAVAYAHRNLIVHRDLKPDNIMVDRQGCAKLLDFGIAKILSTDSTGHTTRALTPAYASPEQITGAPAGTTSDIYSLGCVLYKLLTGHPPHRLDELPPADAVDAVRTGTPDAPAGVDPDLQAIVLQAIEKEPERRYASADELKADLSRYLEGRPVRARGPDGFYRARKWLFRHWLPVAAAAAVLMSISAGLVVSLRQARRAEENLQASRQVAASLTRTIDSAFTAGDPKQALGILDSWLGHLEPLANKHPGDGDLSRVAGVLEFRRCGYIAGFRPQDAPKACESAIARFEPLLGGPLDDEWLRVSLAGAYGTLGRLRAAFGAPAEGEQLVRKSLAVLEPRLAANPGDQSLRAKADSARLYLADTLLLQKRWREALAVQQEAVKGIRSLQQDESRRPLIAAAAASGARFAKVLAKLDPPQAARVLSDSLDLLKDAAESPKAGILEWNEYANALNECTDPAVRRPDEALRFATKAVEASKRRDPLTLDTLAWAYFHKGEKVKAIATMRDALNLVPAAPKTGLRTALERGMDEFSK